MHPEILTGIKHSITQIIKAFNLDLTHKTNPQDRKLKIKNEDALAFALYQHTSTRATKKSVYDDFRSAIGCSYNRFVVAVNRVAVFAMIILFRIMRMGKIYGHIVKYTDATDIPVCLAKNGGRYKTMKHFADWGHSGKGWFYGIKMTMTRDAAGNILALRFSHPGANDRDIFRSVNKDIHGVIVADAGYVSKDLERDMFIEGMRRILIKPYKTMKKLMTRWQEKLYNSRFQIEVDFRSLKMFHGLVTSLPRSINGYIANYLHAILSFVMA